MQVKFNKNIQFTKLVKADGRLREFNFRKIKGANEELFSVDVCDDRGNRVIFRMHKENSDWRIPEQQLPKWISENESNFHTLIVEELRNV